MSAEELKKLIARVEKQMRKAAADLNFEAAAELRDKMVELKMKLQEIEERRKRSKNHEYQVIRPACAGCQDAPA